MAQSRVLHYAARQTVVQLEIPEHRMKAELEDIAGAREPALLSQTALNIVLSRPLRGSSSAAATSMMRTLARITVRATAPATP